MKNRIGSATLLLPEFGGNFRRAVHFHPLSPLLGLGEFILDFLSVVEVVGECGADVAGRDARETVHNLVGAVAPSFMPNDNVLHANAMSRDARSAAADPRRFFDVFGDQVHKSPT